MVTCSNCGETEPSGDRIYCPSCGAELPAADDAGGRDTQRTTGSGQSRSPEPQPGTTSERQQSSAGSGQTRQNRNAANGGGAARRSSSNQPAQSSQSSQSNQPSRSSQPAQSNQPTQQPREPTQEPDARQSRDSRRSPSTGKTGGGRTSSGGGSGTLLGGSSRRTSEPTVSDLAWSIGWRPYATIGGFAIVFLLLAVVAELSAGGIVGVTFVGAVIGSGVWYWGVTEVNDNYTGFRNAFFGQSAKRAENRLGIDKSEVIDTFDFRSHTGGSPPLVEPSKFYRADHMVLSDVSVSVDKDSMYNMKERDTKSTGTTKNIYYDNIESITTNDEGHRTYVRIVTSRGENMRVATVDQTVAEEAQGRLRSKMRDVRRTGR